MKTINKINNIALHYARLTNHPYGTKGTQRNFQVEARFLTKLKAAFKEVFKHCPFGVPEVITTAGILVNKPGPHSRGRAFDLDAIFWEDHTLVSLNFVHQKELYLGIESFLRKHFGIVLNYLYSNHEDHWHVDASVSVDFNEKSKSEVLYVQMVLKYIYDEDILVDGLWGRQTSGMVKTVFNKLKIPTPITTKVKYIKFLELTGKIAFELCKRKNSPLQLLNNITEVIDDLPSQNRNTVQEAFNSFIDHDETETWLNGFGGQDDKHIDEIIAKVIA